MYCIARDVSEMRNNLRMVKKYSLNISQNNISKELSKLRKTHNTGMQMLQDTFATKHLTNPDLISDLSELRLPRITKSPQRLSPLRVEKGEEEENVRKLS